MHTTTNGKAPDTEGNGLGLGVNTGECSGLDFGAQVATTPSPETLPTIRSKRQRRALQSLLTGQQTREQLDRTAGASNAPDIVARMRRRFGLELPCRLERVKDRDGHSVERGVYSLTEADAHTVRRLLADNRGAA